MTAPPGYDGPKPVRVRRKCRVHVSEDYEFTLCGKDCHGWQISPDAVPSCQACLIALAARCR